MTTRLILATGNGHKVREIRELLADLDVEIAHIGELDDPPVLTETGETFAENAREKALACALATGELCVADDSGLMVDALGGEPGVRSARYAGEGASQQDLIDRLLGELEGVDMCGRGGRFVSVISLCSPDGEVGSWEGTVEGVITAEPAGDGGFGYDPVFYYPPGQKTFAEMAPDAKNAVSHRGRALQKMRADLPELLRQQEG